VSWVSATDSYGRIFGFPDRSPYFFLQAAPQLHWVGPVPDPGLEPGPLDLWPGTLTTRPQRRRRHVTVTRKEILRGTVHSKARAGSHQSRIIFKRVLFARACLNRVISPRPLQHVRFSTNKLYHHIKTTNKCLLFLSLPRGDYRWQHCKSLWMDLLCRGFYGLPLPIYTSVVSICTTCSNIRNAPHYRHEVHLAVNKD
jgi:hypothetical protein